MTRWRRFGPAKQFLLVVTLLLILFLSVGGVLQSRLITATLVDNTTRVASIYMEGIISPHVQSLKTSRRLLPDEQFQLETSIADTGLRTQIQQIKIWLPDGTIAYASDQSQIGRRFDSESVRRAVNGETVRNFDDDTEHQGDSAHHYSAILETYIPIRDPGGHVIAVGEFYQDLDAIRDPVFVAIAGNWAIRVVLGIAAVTPLFFIILKADRYIAVQRRVMRVNHRRSVKLARQNLVLSIEADKLRRHAARANEELLSRVGADLHDGPVQLLTLAALNAADPPMAMQLLREATHELRCIASGLVLPELRDLTAGDAVRLAVTRHEQNTGTTVERNIAELSVGISHELKACMYRVVQEALRNIVRHAGGRGQKVAASLDHGTVVIRIDDAGQARPTEARDGQNPGIGLQGVRNRVAAFNGTLEIRRVPGKGTTLIARLPPDLAPAL
ncbi:sensor histidine kinase [Aureimonas glaciei]|uniref:sensor histidine kinase n=1 Tax=Aureimonas glaciei TaxID=1776957 RepID=UPI00166D0F88|nr:ATP-binding protein [Aureimonas glaciei]